MNDNGIAWMIAGGVHAECDEDRRQRLHRVAIAHSNASRGHTIVRLRERIAAMVAPRLVARTDTGSLSADCCPA
jgi:hypothetical protein